MAKKNEEEIKKIEVGKITHFYPKINVAVVELKKALKKGDKILIEGHGNSFTQTVDSMQVEHKNIEKAKAGEVIGLAVKELVKEKDKVFLLKE